MYGFSTTHCAHHMLLLAQMHEFCRFKSGRSPAQRKVHAFTLVELLVVIALIAILAALLMPALGKAKARAQGIYCLNNSRQLSVGWLLYADDHADRLAYNMGGDANRTSVAPRTNLNWVNNIMSWSLDSDNTNITTITDSALGAYTARQYRVYRCPSDNVLSAVQRQAGWTARVRSYSMNAMVGDAGELSASGRNVNNPGYVQYFKLATIPKPSRIFVFLDEHPDSINDGYFLNRASYDSDNEWTDLPASYHDGAASFAFADGHTQLQRWQHRLTKQPAVPQGADLPLSVPAAEVSDLSWVLDHMSSRY